MVSKTACAAQADTDSYFRGDHALDSWSGHVPAKDCMTELQLKKYVEHENPGLFKRLFGMPDTAIDNSWDYQIDIIMSGICKATESVPQHPFPQTPDICTNDTGDATALELAIKTRLRACLLDGVLFALRTESDERYIHMCNGPVCQGDSAIQMGDLFLAFTADSPWGIKQLRSRNANSVWVLCLDCFVAIFNDNGRATEEDGGEGSVKGGAKGGSARSNGTLSDLQDGFTILDGLHL